MFLNSYIFAKCETKMT